MWMGTMKNGGIIGRYVFREMIPPFLVNLAFFTFIFLMAKILNVTKLIVNYGVGLTPVLLMLTYFIPSFLVFIVPMSVMMGILLAFLRLSHDNEVVALKAGGFSVYRLLPPVFVFCAVGSLLTGLMTVYGAPWGKVASKALLFETAKSNISMGLKEKTFTDRFTGMMLYVNEIDLKELLLTDVFIEDQQTPGMVSTVIAPKGKIVPNPEELKFRLTLFNGMVNRVDLNKKAVYSVSFDTYDLNLELVELFSAGKFGRSGRKQSEMTLEELRRALEGVEKTARYNSMLMEYHKKFSIPFACFVLGLLAVSLGLQSRSEKRSSGMVLGLFWFLVYYVLLSAGWICGESGLCPPVVGMWGPNLMFGLLGLYLLTATANERPVGVIAFLAAALTRPGSLLTGRTAR
jgi:lipopolysaccharide export system permease protein